ncbi:hypothetical protein GCM10017786_51020 [Amycolatopsis deserti]|uniref:Uncharacterized protein n=1 Tax=Amycolatopsis deserti TaxID=185696 RepID=A0ABQ3JCQ0_9PSEU|nr:hypothetical protein [Amycolatopsis deserti]GHF11113.1 hypothetical protein GCM10017786_51020 [Amycolatopsis deserti]
MRNTGLMKTTRRALTVTAVAAAIAGGSLLSAGTASASTVLSQACTGTVIGALSDSVAVQGKDLAGVVKAGAQEQEWFLHLNGVDPQKVADTVSKAGAITVGQIPANAASGTIAGDAIATAVATTLKNAGDPYAVGLGIGADQQKKTLDAISHKVSGNCGLTTYANNYTQPGLPTTQQPGTATPAPGTSPATTSPGIAGTGSATAPPRNYGNIPAAVPGVAGVAVPPGALYPSSATLPDQALPQVGVLGGQSTSAGGQADVRNAGNASAIAGEPASGNVQLPMLLAVVALAGVSAALVRTWVLRKLS